MHYDPGGIYGHIDHVQVNRAGAIVARGLRLTGYQATVDAAALRAGPRHLLHRVVGDRTDVGVPAAGISVTVDAVGPDLAASELFLIGTRGAAVAAERGIEAGWTGAMPSHSGADCVD